MRQIVLTILLASITFSNVFGQIDTSSVNDQDSLQAEASLELVGLSFEFELAKDTLTLVPFDYGSLTVGWESISTENSGLQFVYWSSNESKQSVIIGSGETTFEINSLGENEFFFYYFENIETGAHSETSIFNTLAHTIFKNNSASAKAEGVKLSWGIPLDLLNKIVAKYPEASYSIKWNTKIGAKRHKSDSSVAKWEHLDNISINNVAHKIDDLEGGQKYVYKVGLNTGEKTIWSKKGKFETDRVWGLFKLLILIGSLGLFIFGMKIMSEGLQKAAGSRLRNMLASITSNRIKGVFTGLGITSVVQSSSVTTVMTVSFVNAGLMTLRQAAGVIMGANIGTTMTAWLILLFGFKVDIAGYALILIAFGAPLLFFAKSSIRNWAAVVIGFSLLFMGLGFLKESVPNIGADSPLVQFFIDYKDSGLLGTLMFVGLGTLATVIIQSSSATMALTMTLVAGGVLPFEVAAAMILGENIGTTITAQLAALIGNVHAKRAARIHAYFNLLGVIWCIIVFHFFLKGIAYFIDGDPFSNPEAANEGLAIFHSVFNVMNVLLLIWFVPRLVRIAELSVKSKGREDEEFHLDYIGTGMMGTPDLSILEAKKEVAKFGAITARMSEFVQDLMKEQNKKKKQYLMDKISKYEEITDRVEIEVTTYLAKVSSGDMTEKTARRIRTMNSIVNDLETIGDIFYQMSKTIERKDEEKVYFIPEQRQSILDMFKLVDNAFEVMVNNLKADWDGITHDEALEAELAINAKRDAMRLEHLENVEQVGFNMSSGMSFNNLFMQCEKAGDHIINVTEAISGNIE